MAIHVVHAYAGPAYHAQLLAGLDDLGGDLGPAADDEAVVFADYLEQFLFRYLGPDIDLDPGVLGQHLQAFLG
jgi:hypothetical protein